VRVQEGSTLRDVALRLEERNVVTSSFWLSTFVRVQGGDEKVRAGDYFFERPEGLFSIARRLLTGDFNLKLIKVSIPEGATLAEMSEIFDARFDTFDSKRFAELTRGKEGYVFPDTYFFLPNITTDDIARTLEQTFNERIATIEGYITDFGKPLTDIIVMASILEREARTTESRRIISGILWKRLSIDMPLQVDAVFVYTDGKGSFDLTLDDLRNTENKYNTYVNKGLPPGPIANPGLDAILAAVLPVESDYLYYLSDRRGKMYYAATFEQHKANKVKYLW